MLVTRIISLRKDHLYGTALFLKYYDSVVPPVRIAYSSLKYYLLIEILPVYCLPVPFKIFSEEIGNA